MPTILWVETPAAAPQFLDSFALQPCKVIDKGSQVETANGIRTYDKTLIGFEVSKADFTEIEKQITEAISFFNDHAVAFASLFSKDSVSARIDFGFYTTFVDQKIVVQHDHFPSALLLHLGQLNIDLDLSQFWYGGQQDLASI